jgi:hypothetical protein
MSTTVTVRVLLNWVNPDSSRAQGRIPFLSPYESGDRLRETVAFDTALPDHHAIEALLEEIFAELNIDSPVESWAIEYRNEGNRSLSVGDVVTVGEQAWSVERDGFTPVSVSLDQLIPPHVR